MSIILKNALFLIMLLLSICYCLLYILRDFYFSTENFQMKKNINKILPFFTKYNGVFLILLLIISIFNFYTMYISNILFFIILTSIALSLAFIYLPKIKFYFSNYVRLLSYILFLEVILIPIT